MKKIQLLAVALAAATGASLTSCMNSNDTGERSMQLFASVNTASMFGGYVFTSADGVKVTPSLEAETKLDLSNKFGSNANLAYIAFNYDKEEREAEEAAGQTDWEKVDMWYAESLDGEILVTSKGGSQDSLSMEGYKKYPVIDLEKEAGMLGDIGKPWFFDRHTLVLPINYFFYDKQHKFSLIYYGEDDSEEADGVPTFHLWQTSPEQEGGSRQSYDYSGFYPPYYFYAFDLRTVFGYADGDMPSEIRIKYYKNINDSAGDSGTEQEVLVDCTPLIDKK